MDCPGDKLTIYVSGERWLGVPPLVLSLSCNRACELCGGTMSCVNCAMAFLCLAPMPFLASDLCARAIGADAFPQGQRVSRRASSTTASSLATRRILGEHAGLCRQPETRATFWFRSQRLTPRKNVDDGGVRHLRESQSVLGCVCASHQ